MSRRLARQQINEQPDGVFLRSDDGDARFDPVPARPDPGLIRRLRTRVSIDRHTGTAADGRLFTIEQVEPWLAPKNHQKPRRTTFVCRVENLDQSAAELLALAADLPILIGAGRNHGMGRALLQVHFEAEETIENAELRVLKLTGLVRQEAVRLARHAGLPHPEDAANHGQAVLALLALSDFVPSHPEAAHPLAELAEPGLQDIHPLRRFLNPGQVGGYNQLVEGGALKDLAPSVGAGSVFVYRIQRQGLTPLLDRLLPRLRRGVGRDCASGCGRFGLFEPFFPRRRRMSAEPEVGSKSWLVGRAENILGNQVPRNQASQLRNLVQITQKESEVPVLANFIRYQAGRKATGGFWRPIHKQVIEVLQKIEEKFPAEDERKAAIQNFFGYMVRHYVYLEGAGERGSTSSKPKGGAPHGRN